MIGSLSTVAHSVPRRLWTVRDDPGETVPFIRTDVLAATHSAFTRWEPDFDFGCPCLLGFSLLTHPLLPENRSALSTLA